ncbi:MAG: geranylgeranylglycerol-phosphate geranylgeranyltransferase, partial [Bacteroidales bacterium]|nr:geranylgeranylglycerol-phosphate geranylgeranyltransferase [Bacteroidales bacterium]
AAGGYVINDIFDIEIDKINKPDKVLINKTISLSKAYQLYYGLTIVGTLTGFYLAFAVQYFLLGFIFVATVLLLWFYSSKYQKTVLWGNIFISGLSAMVIIIVWLFELYALRADILTYTEVMKQIHVVSILVTAYGLFAFLVSMIREIAKDIEDMDGDKSASYKTLPIKVGTKKAKLLANVLIIVSVLLLAYAQYHLYIKGIMLVFWYLLVAVQTLFLFLLYNSVKAESKEDFQFLSNACKIIMVAGILSMQLFYVSF